MLRLARLVLAAAALLAAARSEDAQPNITYRWVYRNPLSILAADVNAQDEGMGSYFGVRDSVHNAVEEGPHLALTYSHGATLAFLPNGSLATIWQASTQWWEGSRRQSAYWSLSDDEGDTWGPPLELFSNTSKGGGPIWGPQLHVHDQTLYMLFSSTAPPTCEESAGQGGGTMWPPGGSLMVTTSSDNGEIWGEPQTVFSADADGGIAKLNVARITVTADGKWLLPFWREASGPSACWGAAGLSYHGVPGVFTSSNQGKSWELGVQQIRKAPGTPRSKWLIENAISPYNDTATSQSGLLQVFRDDTGKLWQSTSIDDGVTWTDAAPGTLPSPDSKADIWPLPGGSVIAAFNNVTDATRQNLSLAVTADGGKLWCHVALLEGNTSRAPHTGGFSYPTVLYLPNSNRILVVYSVGYPKISKPALMAGSPAMAPGVYFRRDISSGLPGPLSETRRSVSETRRGAALGGRRILRVLKPFPQHDGTQSRRLHQMPFHYGAWNMISYGVRLAYLDAEIALQTAIACRAKS